MRARAPGVPLRHAVPAPPAWCCATRQQHRVDLMRVGRAAGGVWRPRCGRVLLPQPLLPQLPQLLPQLWSCRSQERGDGLDVVKLVQQQIGEVHVAAKWRQWAVHARGLCSCVAAGEAHARLGCG